MPLWLFSSNAESWLGWLTSGGSWDAASKSFKSQSLSGNNYAEAGGLSPTFTPLEISASTVLAFDYRLFVPNNDTTSILDSYIVLSRPVGDNILITGSVAQFSGIDTGWQYHTVDISAHIGEEIDYIEIGWVRSGTARPWLVYLDNVNFGLSYSSFHFGQGPGENVLSAYFVLPFPGTKPGAMTLDQSLGTVVLGTLGGGPEAAVYGTYPYITGTSFSDGHPTGTSIVSMKWV